MAKRILKITEFNGGDNRVKDPRDLDNNESAKALGIEFDKIGRIRVSGGGQVITPLSDVASEGINGTLHTIHGGAPSSDFSNYKINSGYGIYNFNHDYSMDDVGNGSNPFEVSTEYIAFAYRDVSDFLKIGFINSNAYNFEWNNVLQQAGATWFPNVIDLDYQSNDPEVSYYFIDGGLRIFDGNFDNTTTNTYYGHVKRTMFEDISDAIYTSGGGLNNGGIWIKENQSLELLDSTSFAFEDNRPAEGTSKATSTLFTDILSADLITNPYQVLLEIGENTLTGAGNIIQTISTSTFSGGITTVNCGAAHGLVAGDMVEIFDLGDAAIFNGQYEVVGITDADTFTISAETNDEDFDSDGGKVTKAENILNAELRASWIYGISYVLDGGQETKIATSSVEGDLHTSLSDGIMTTSNAHDWTSFTTEPRMRFTFAHQYKDNESTYAWSERVTGFRIYMKNVDGTTLEVTTQEWHLMVDVDFRKGVYTLPGTDSTERVLTHANGQFYNVANASSAGGDDVRFLSPITYESLNGYSNDETIDARYKTAVIANEKCYIGNIKQNNQTYPDRILKSPVNQYDVFPESSFVEGITSDGDSIIKLEYYGDKLFCFKKNVLQIINISSEVEEIEESLQGYGISHPNQVVKTNDGIAFVNKTGLYTHNGTELKDLTKDKRKPFSFASKEIRGASVGQGFFFEGAIPSLGYDQESNKLILLRASTAYDFQVTVSADNTQSINQAFNVIGGTFGYVYTGNGYSIPNIGDIFQVQGAHDFTGDDLSYAKYGEGGRAPTQYDYFRVTGNFYNNQQVEYIDLDADVLIYDLDNDCISYRVFAFGANNTGYNMTNFINTNMIGSNNKLLLFRDTSAASQNGSDIDIMEWDDHPVTITDNNTFELKTKDIDFGDPAVRKKIYKIYITFRTNDGKGTHANSEIRVYHLANQNTDSTWTNLSDYTEFSDNSTNYSSANGLYSESSDDDWQQAVLVPTSSINNIYSFQLLFRNAAGNVPRGFEINDISIVYREKPIR